MKVLFKGSYQSLSSSRQFLNMIYSCYLYADFEFRFQFDTFEYLKKFDPEYQKIEKYILKDSEEFDYDIAIVHNSKLETKKPVVYYLTRADDLKKYHEIVMTNTKVHRDLKVRYAVKSCFVGPFMREILLPDNLKRNYHTVCSESERSVELMVVRIEQKTYQETIYHLKTLKNWKEIMSITWEFFMLKAAEDFMLPAAEFITASPETVQVRFDSSISRIPADVYGTELRNFFEQTSPAYLLDIKKRILNEYTLKPCFERLKSFIETL